MAVSKNNRKTGKKRNKARMSPQTQAQRAEKNNSSVGESMKSMDWIAIVGMFLMVAGFIGAMMTSYGLIYYPITFIGSLMCMFRTPRDTKLHTFTFLCYGIYCVAVVFLWVQIIMGKA